MFCFAPDRRRETVEAAFGFILLLFDFILFCRGSVRSYIMIVVIFCLARDRCCETVAAAFVLFYYCCLVLFYHYCYVLLGRETLS